LRVAKPIYSKDTNSNGKDAESPECFESVGRSAKSTKAANTVEGQKN
jgi:hypothetical protein